MKRRTVIITGGGVGKRMGANIPKQFVAIGGKPILMHTISQFVLFDTNIQIILVLPKDQIEFWESLCTQYDFQVEHTIVIGGRERYHSVKEGLALAVGDVVAVHDAVRPFASLEVIQSCFSEADQKGAAIPVIHPKESLRRIKGESSHAVDRSVYRVVQTPQCFRLSILQEAYEQSYDERFTDDASVVEKTGVEVYLVKGNEDNIKLTVPLDMIMAEELLKRQ